MHKNTVITVIVSLALFMEALDTNIINTAIPAMSASFSVNPIDLKIALISYLLSLAVFIPISGWLADKFGTKRVFLSAIVCFTLSSIWCGFSENLFMLVIARILQGLGGSLMIPIGRLILLRTFPRHEYIETMNKVIIVVSMGLMLGPVLGGFITHYLSWQWIFWVNIPIGILNFYLAYHWLDNTPPCKVHPLDKIGFILFGCGLAAFTFSLSAMSESTISHIYTAMIMFIAICLLVGYFWHSRRKTHPIVKTSLFKLRTFRISVLSSMLARIGFGGFPFLLPLLLQIGLHYSSQTAGLMLAPIALGVLAIKPFTLVLLRRFGYKKLLIFNTFLVGLAMWSFAFVDQNTPYYVIALATFLYGFLISLQYGGINSLAYADVSAHDLSAVTSIVSTIQQLSQSFGVAVVAILIRINNPGPVEILDPQVFHQTFFYMGAFTMLSVFIFFRLQANDGEQMISQAALEKETEVMA